MCNIRSALCNLQCDLGSVFGVPFTCCGVCGGEVQCGAQCNGLVARRCVGVSPGGASPGIGGRPTRLIGRQITLAAKY